MKKRIRIVMSLALVLVLALSSVVYAAPKEGRGYNKNETVKNEPNGNAWGFYRNRQIEGHVKINANRIRVNGRGADFTDVGPVIKDGRTLLPLRAIVETLGGYVYWDEDTSTAAVINSELTMMILFDLRVVDGEEDQETGITIYEYNGEDKLNPLGYDPFDADSGDWDMTDENYPLDVLPGIINNRTFVPLRFIAETFGLMVFYDEDSGAIDINQEPNLYPNNINYEIGSEDDIRVGIVLNGFEFVGVTQEDVEELPDLNEFEILETFDYTTQAAIVISTTEPGLFLTLSEYDGTEAEPDDHDNFIEQLSEIADEGIVKLYFWFTKDDVDIVKTFRIKLKE